MTAAGLDDRHADATQANERSIYAHFDKVVAESMTELAAAVSIDAGNLPDYAGELYDRLEQRPHVRRLYPWAGLERQQPIDAAVEEYRRNVTAIQAAQKQAVSAPTSRPWNSWPW